jgi:hypothetical protein
MADPTPTSPRRSTLAKVLRWTLPFLVSGLFFAFLLSRIDFGAVRGRVSAEVAAGFLPPLALYLAASLWIEAISLQLAITGSGQLAGRWMAARIKAASYLLGLINYALGAGALSVLLRRRARMSLADAAGAVFLIALLDLTSLLGFVIAAVLAGGADTPGLRAGVVLAAAAAIVTGFVVLRAPVSFGALDRLRNLQVFRAARTLPARPLITLGLLRLAFVASFMAMAWATLAAFGISVPMVPFVVNVAILLLVAALPIAAAGLGTGQLAFVELFGRFADDETLLAASLTLSFGMIVTRAAIGLCFAREFTSEALAAVRETDA